jgi:hypothetical protein
MKLGEYLKQIRDERAPTQEEFVKWLKTFMKVSTSTYSLWERDVSTPNFIQMCKIMKKRKSSPQGSRNRSRSYGYLISWEPLSTLQSYTINPCMKCDSYRPNIGCSMIRMTTIGRTMAFLLLREATLRGGSVTPHLQDRPAEIAIDNYNPSDPN